ncbi:MAG: HD domain-containing protein [Cyanobacteria bacterium REEB67]|nr:HD domain-containing protein [Cyanobacteria bacterium REEB67]
MSAGHPIFESPLSRATATPESASDKLSREAGLFDDTCRGVVNRVEELAHHPRELGVELGTSALIGAGLALAQGRAGLIREGAQVVGLAMSASFVLDSSRKAAFALRSVADTWNAPITPQDRAARGNTLGAFLVDTTVMSAGGMAGLKLGRNSSIYMGVHNSIDKAMGLPTLEQHAQLRRQMLAYHPLTAHHQDRVGGLSRVIAEGLNMPPGSVERAYLAGNMHDIGKMKTPKEILDFPGRLEGHERDVMNHHATETGTILRENVTYPRRLADLPSVAENHHERLDGKGTPNALSAFEIAPETRVNTVADVFDVLSHSRSYKAPTPVSQLVDVLDSGRGTQFDGTVLDAFYRQRASKVLPFMLADSSHPVLRNPQWLPEFKNVQIGDLLRSVKQGVPVEGTKISQAQIDKFNSLYDGSHQGMSP